MRFDGIIKSWNDERGFGFIEPTQGGQEVFVHIKAFNQLRARPQPKQKVSFAVELGPQGKKRATSVEMLQIRRLISSAPEVCAPDKWRGATLFSIAGFLILLTLASIFGQPPQWFLWLYPAASAVTFLAYALDKNAARKGAYRTPESTLHLFALIGGWPGALLAQQFFRHKTVKAEFRSIFWGTVLANMAAFMVLSTPIGQTLLRH